ncbi:MAG: hypothetical protein KAI29_02690, partial [Cyclobacteriaceae bacterium]|nr:hypothetical protein [Cyclobacteriaceae bacterium]
DSLSAVVNKAPEFLDETISAYPGHQPYMALFLAFIKIFEFAQNHINTLTLKHLNFYYQDILGLDPNPEQPDEVHLVFELAKTFSAHKLDKHSLFKAGKDNNKEEVFFSSNDELVINKTILAEKGLRSVFVEKEYSPDPDDESYTIKNIYAAPIANSKDGLGEVIEDEEGKWKTFGDNQRPYASIGFAVASPMFLLKEGNRDITLRFAVDKVIGNGNSITDKTAFELKHNIQVFYSGEKEWGNCKITEVEIGLDPENTEKYLQFNLNIPSGMPPFMAYDEKIHQSGLTANYPVLKFILDNKGYAAEVFFNTCQPITNVSQLGNVSPLISTRILDFLNIADTPEEIAGTEPLVGTVIDNPLTGYSQERPGYDIGIDTAEEILLARPTSGFTSLMEIEEVPGVGIDKINDLIHSFSFDLCNLAFIKEVSKEYDSAIDYEAGQFVFFESYLYEANVDSTGYLPPDNPTQWLPIERSYPYQYIKDLEIQSLKIDIDVSGMKDLVLESDIGKLNPAKPFQPFGPIPKVGSKFFIGSHEIFQKSIQSIDCHLTWADLPGNFNTHYENYDDNTSTSPVLNNYHFNVGYELLFEGRWLKSNVIDANSPLKTEKANLFEPESGQLSNERDLEIVIDSTIFGRRPNQEYFTNIRPDTSAGFIRMDLQQDFFHKKYPTYLAKAAISPSTHNVPNEPYTPTLSAISIDYSATEFIDYTKTEKKDYKERIEQLFHIHPFGNAEFYPIKSTSDDKILVNKFMLPQFLVNETDPKTQELITSDAEGTLYIGLDGLVPPQSLSILFQVSEGSADPDKPKQEIIWSYLSYNQWKDFETTEIISEDSNDFLRSGIVKLSIPRAISSDNTTLPDETFWIKASVARETLAVSQLIAVTPQAVKATFDKSAKNDLNRLLSPLPAETISKLKFRHAGVKKIQQPYSSFNGKWVEKLIEDIMDINDLEFSEINNAYYIRVSERLRHKGRGVNIWDCERLILEKFPDVYKAKCISHTSQDSEHAPGFVKLIVIPNLRNKNAIDPYRPRLSLNILDEIRKYLKDRISDFITLDVKNPLYETVMVSFKVVLHPDKDAGYYLNQMQSDIRKFLTPWLFDEGVDLILGGRIHRSSILNFLEETDYVDYITDFKMYHKVEENDPWVEVEEAVAVTESSTMVSEPLHDIELLKEVDA